MARKFFDWYSWGLTIFALLGLLVSLCCFGNSSCWDLSGVNVVIYGDYLCFDFIGGFLSLLSVLLGFSIFCMWNVLSVRSFVFVLTSVLFSVLSFLCSHALLFWVCYELSILFLLFLLISESPYSERYMAAWYLVGYVVLTSLPMLLSILYLSVVGGSYVMASWSLDGDSVVVLLLLGVLFVTKVPVPPFHVWLPIVHAEAESVVSVCLSGYIMKLGLLGVCRFCSNILPLGLFCETYIVFSFSMSLIFFLCACRELDGKRWLAFLSLSHILVAVVCLACSSFVGSGLSFFYSLAHGLSAGLVFILLWWCYEVCGSRNWLLIKTVMGGSLFNRLIVCLSLCSAASLPPTVQFFCEVFVLFEVGKFSACVFGVFCLYLFVSSLVPFFLLGSLVTRHSSVSLLEVTSFDCLIMGMLFIGLFSVLLFALV
uniref:NADH-ubiquinone oxidoreductase chain 4 n=1 Tax=Clinostomum complanatum TaxID=235145 RepID=A0A649X6N1_CLICO|nr:NADH dehydrogenase subunit 4 [Clinostomum complanatum]UYP50944.1 NADH dehydrogenase subunit 4 [Clinostomum complanatum]